MKPCANPAICGVQSHRPGTICAAASGSASHNSASKASRPDRSFGAPPASRSTEVFGVKAKTTPPTQNHRPAMWSGALGTVYAMSESGEVRYFDYDKEGAAEFAGVSTDRDPRWAPKSRNVRYSNSPEEPQGRSTKILWVTKA